MYSMILPIFHILTLRFDQQYLQYIYDSYYIYVLEYILVLFFFSSSSPMMSNMAVIYQHCHDPKLPIFLLGTVQYLPSSYVQYYI